jgi:hypothetical protein
VLATWALGVDAGSKVVGVLGCLKRCSCVLLMLYLRMCGAQVCDLLGKMRNVPSVREHREHSPCSRNNDVYLAGIKLKYFEVANLIGSVC